VLDTLANLKDTNQKIGIIAYKMATCNFQEFVHSLRNISKIDIEVINYITPYNFQDAFKTAREKNINTIIGGSFAVEEAQKAGFNAIEILPTECTINNIFHQAKQIIHAKRKEEEDAVWHTKFFETIDEGIITINHNKVITEINQKALELLKINYLKAKYKPVLDFMPSLKDTVEARTAIKDKVIDIDGENYAINYLPLRLSKRSFGAIINLQNVSTIQNLENIIREKTHNKGLSAKFHLSDILGTSEQIEAVKKKSLKYAKTDFNIFIEGETGTGKELFAQGVHLASSRASGPFVAINCASLPENLLESELFGYNEGAFTGAKKGGKEGLFELAHNGTVFLDEIGSMGYSMQARLLRVIQEKEVMRVGGAKVIPVNTRIVAATNIPIFKQVQEGTFRKDLYFRINELNIRIPPLRVRRSDIPILYEHFLKSNLPGKEQNLNYPKVKSMIQKTIKLLDTYDWPGNIRELENCIKRIIALYEELNSDSISYEQFVKELAFPGSESTNNNNQIMVNLGTLKEMEEQLILKVYEQLDNNKSAAADALNVSRTTLWRHLNI